MCSAGMEEKILLDGYLVDLWTHPDPHQFVNMDSPSFACGMCGKCFSDAEQIPQHIQTHLGQKSFGCIICWPLFFDMSSQEMTQPCVPSKPVSSVTLASSRKASASQVTDAQQDNASDEVPSSTSAATVELSEPPVTPSLQCFKLTSSDIRTASHHAEEVFTVENGDNVSVAKRGSIVDECQSDDGPPHLEAECNIVVGGNTDNGSRLKTPLDVKVDQSKSVEDRSQEFPTISPDQEVLKDLSPKDVSAESGQKDTANSVERDSSCMKVISAPHVQQVNIVASSEEAKESAEVKDDLDPRSSIQEHVLKVDPDSTVDQKNMLENMCEHVNQFETNPKQDVAVTVAGEELSHDTVCGDAPTRIDANDAVHSLQKDDLLGIDSNGVTCTTSTHEENGLVITPEESAHDTVVKSTSGKPVQSDRSGRTPQDKSAITMQEGDLEDSASKQSAEPGFESKTHADGTLKDSGKTIDPTKHLGSAAISGIEMPCVRTDARCSYFVCKTSLWDSDSGVQKDVTSSDNSTRANKSSNHSGMKWKPLPFGAQGQKLLPTINVPMQQDLKFVQYSFEELIASADFLEQQLVDKEIVEECWNDMKCETSSHSGKQEEVDFFPTSPCSSASSQSRSSSELSGCIRTASGRRKKSKPKKLAVESTPHPQLGGSHCPKVGNDENKPEVSDAPDPPPPHTLICVDSEPGDNERNQNTDNGDKDHNLIDSASPLQSAERPDAAVIPQTENTPCELNTKDIAQEVIGNEHSERRDSDVDETKATDTGVNFDKLISCLKNIQVKKPSVPQYSGVIEPNNNTCDRKPCEVKKSVPENVALSDLTSSVHTASHDSSGQNIICDRQPCEVKKYMPENVALSDLTSSVHTASHDSSGENIICDKQPCEVKKSVPENVALSDLTSSVHTASHDSSGENIICDRQPCEVKKSVPENVALSDLTSSVHTASHDSSDTDCPQISEEVNIRSPRSASVAVDSNSAGTDAASNKENLMFSESISRRLSVRLSRISKRMLVRLLAGETIKVNRKDSPRHRSSSLIVQQDDHSALPVKPVKIQSSEDIHECGVQEHDFWGKYDVEENQPEKAEKDSSGSFRVPMQQSHQPEFSCLQRSCDSDRDEQQTDDHADPKSLSNVPGSEKPSEMQKTYPLKKHKSHEGVAAKTQVDQSESSGMNDSGAQMVEDNVDMKVSCKQQHMQYNRRNGTDGTQLTDCEEDKRTEVDKHLISAGSLEYSLQVSVCHLENSKGKFLEKCRWKGRKRVVKARETCPVKKRRRSAEQQMISVKETSDDNQEEVNVQHVAWNVPCDSAYRVDNQSSISTNMDKEKAVSHIRNNSHLMSGGNTHSALGSKTLNATDLPVTSEQIEQASRAMFSEGKLNPVRRASEESLENLDLPEIKPRGARQKRTSEFYWKLRHAKTWAIVAKGRQEEHTSAMLCTFEPQDKSLSLNSPCKVHPESSPEDAELESFSSQQDYAESSHVMTSAECGQNQNEMEDTSPSDGNQQTDEKKNMDGDQITETIPINSETLKLSSSTEVFTPSVAESVKRAATRRKSAVQASSDVYGTKEKTEEMVSKNAMVSEMYGTGNGQMKKIKKHFRVKEDLFREREKASLSTETMHFEEEKNDDSITAVNKIHKLSRAGVKFKRFLCYTCSECGAVFRKYLKYVSHLAYGCKTRFECHICGSSLGRKESLKIHMTIHTGEAAVTCHICGKTLAGRHSLTNHLRIHTGERPYKCPECSKFFRHNSALTAHRRTHSKERPFKCSICDKSYRFLKSLYDHQTTHTGERPYACHICSAAFFQMGALNNHLKKHSGESPFGCNFCGMRFTQKVQLDKHTRQSHPHKIREMEYKKAKEAAKPYLCNMCNRGFNSLSSMYRHMRSFCFLLKEGGQEAA